MGDGAAGTGALELLAQVLAQLELHQLLLLVQLDQEWESNTTIDSSDESHFCDNCFHCCFCCQF